MANEKSIMPTRKVTGGLVLGVPVGVIVVWIISQFGHIQVPPEVATAMGSVFSFIFSYLIPERE